MRSASLQTGTPACAGPVLITGASGLLGRALTAAAAEEGLAVLAHFFTRPAFTAERVTWIRGDFTTVAGVRRFLEKNESDLRRCRYFVHNYGPMTFKPTGDLTGGDFLADMTGNLATAAEIIFFLLRRARLEAVVNIGYSEAGSTRAFRKILPYALAKNALLDLTRSLARTFTGVRFNMVSPGTIAGATHGRGGEPEAPPEAVAGQVLRVLLGRSSGRHYRALLPCKRRQRIL